jgi:hypothetical protein
MIKIKSKIDIYFSQFQSLECRDINIAYNIWFTLGGNEH